MVAGIAIFMFVTGLFSAGGSDGNPRMKKSDPEDMHFQDLKESLDKHDNRLHNLAIALDKLTTVIRNSLPCPLPWTKFEYTCLYFVKQKKDWYQADHYCRSIGGMLVWIRDLEEHLIINRFLRELQIGSRLSYWIGLYRTNLNSTTMWVDSKINVFRYRGLPSKDDGELAFASESYGVTIRSHWPRSEFHAVCRRHI